MTTRTLHQRFFLIVLAIFTLAFLGVLAPFSGAVLWGVSLALIFLPLFERLLKKFPARRNLAAILTLLVVVLIAIIPLGLIILSLVEESSKLAVKVQSGEINVSALMNQAVQAAPQWLKDLLSRFGIDSIEDLVAQLSASAGKGSEAIAERALTIGSSTFDVLVQFTVMLYLLFFLLRDGRAISKTVTTHVPLPRRHLAVLQKKLVATLTATVKGNVVVALVQGGLGGLAFWVLGVPGALLGASLMAFLSLLPAIGAALVWAPVALYFLVTGAVVKGIILIAFGSIVIGLVDNILRPILVGRDTEMPDYIALISTLGGIALFGINGFVIGPVIAALFMSGWQLLTGTVSDSEEEPAAD